LVCFAKVTSGRRQQPSGGEILFPIDKRVTGTDRRTAKMMEQDLGAARRKWLSESDQERADREKTDFLKYIDSQNRYADFHSNRHTFITNLSLVGVLPHDAQELARHSDIRLTMNLYTHVGLADKAKAIAKLAGLGEGAGQGSLPRFTASEFGATQFRLRGTDVVHLVGPPRFR